MRVEGGGTRATMAPVVILGLVGFLVGLLVQVTGLRHTKESHLLTRTSFFQVWAFIESAQVGVWFALSPPLWRAIRDVRSRHVPVPRGDWIALALVVMVAVIPTLLVEPGSPLAYHDWKTGMLTVFGASVGGVGLWGLWKAVHVVAAIEAEARTGQPTPAALQALLRLRSRIVAFLTVAGAVVGCAILATGARRQAQLLAYAQFPVVFEGAGWRAEDFSAEFVLVYGAYFTALLGLCYAPVHARYHEALGAMVDLAVPCPSETRDWGAWASARASLLATARIALHEPGGLKVLGPIFSPLLGAIASVALDFH